MGTDLEAAENRLTDTLAEVKVKMRRKLAGMAGDAVETLNDLMLLSDSDEVRFKAATKVLSLVGVSEMAEPKVTVSIDAGVDGEVNEVLARLQKNQEMAQRVGEITHTPEEVIEAEIVSDETAEVVPTPTWQQ